MNNYQLEKLFEIDNQEYFFDKDFYATMDIESAIASAFMEYLDTDFSLFLLGILSIDGVDIKKVTHKVKNGIGA